MKRFLWIFLAGLLFFTASTSFLIQKSRRDNAFNRTREQLLLIASNAALLISADEVFDLPLEQKSEWTPEYQVIYKKLVKIKEANPSLKYVYVMAATNQPGILQYVVDANPVPEIITAKCPTSLPGDKYDALAKRAQEMSETGGPTSTTEGVCSYTSQGFSVDVYGELLVCCYAGETSGCFGNIRQIATPEDLLRHF